MSGTTHEALRPLDCAVSRVGVERGGDVDAASRGVGARGGVGGSLGGGGECMTRAFGSRGGVFDSESCEDGDGGGARRPRADAGAGRGGDFRSRAVGFSIDAAKGSQAGGVFGRDTADGGEGGGDLDAGVGDVENGADRCDAVGGVFAAGGGVLSTSEDATRAVGGDDVIDAAIGFAGGGIWLDNAATLCERGGESAPIDGRGLDLAAAHAMKEPPMADSYEELFWEARRVTGTWTNGALAALVGTSKRTIERHGGVGDGEQMKKLILATHAKDPDLARRLAKVAGHDVHALGIAPPPPAAAVPAAVAGLPPAEVLRGQADSVLLAAAHAANQPPEAVRAVVAAAFARARDMKADPAKIAALLAKPLTVQR